MQVRNQHHPRTTTRWKRVRIFDLDHDNESPRSAIRKESSHWCHLSNKHNRERTNESVIHATFYCSKLTKTAQDSNQFHRSNIQSKRLRQKKWDHVCPPRNRLISWRELTGKFDRWKITPPTRICPMPRTSCIYFLLLYDMANTNGEGTS